MNFILRTLVTACVAFGLTKILPSVHFNDFTTAIVFAFILAVLNAIVKPLLIFFTLPITVFTLGLFLFVINAGIVLMADSLLASMYIDGFWWAMLFSILLSFITSVLTKMIWPERK